MRLKVKRVTKLRLSERELITILESLIIVSRGETTVHVNSLLQENARDLREAIVRRLEAAAEDELIDMK